MGRKALNPNQLSMFMSPAEITQHYQALDADRAEFGDYNYGYASGPQGLPHSAWSQASSRSTHRNEPDIRVYKATYETHTRGGGPAVRTGGGGLYRQREGWEEPSGETDEQLYERKAEEATEYGNYDESGKYTSLYENIEQHGVQHPIHLGTQFGSMDKPQIVGGHHRLAAQRDINPHALMPVIHHEGGIRQARAEGQAAASGEGGYRYR